MVITRDTQKVDVIYVLTGTGTAFVTPDGEGRYWYSRRYYQEQEIEMPVDLEGLLEAELDDDEAAVIVAKYEHGDDLPAVHLDLDEFEDD